MKLPKPQSKQALPQEALYRRLHEESLRENRPDLYASLARSNQLSDHLKNVSHAAALDHASHLAYLRKHDPYQPSRHGSRRQYETSLEDRAKELVLNDRVLVPTKEDQRWLESEGQDGDPTTGSLPLIALAQGEPSPKPGTTSAPSDF